jgi:hypothetical protein
LSTRIEAARRETAFLREVAGLVGSRPKSMGTSETTESLRDVLRERKNSGKNLMKLGAALLLMPDPITDVAAVPVLIAGKMVSARESVNIKGVYDEVRQTLSCLSSP